jgi:hypothetical protein
MFQLSESFSFTNRTPNFRNPMASIIKLTFEHSVDNPPLSVKNFNVHRNGWLLVERDLEREGSKGKQRGKG